LPRNKKVLLRNRSFAKILFIFAKSKGLARKKKVLSKGKDLAKKR